MSRVARYHADRTNQKLYFARLACRQAEQESNVQQKQAQCEAALFHLNGAVLAFLQELVRYYKLSDLKPSLSSIERILAERDQVSPEIVQLKALSQHGFLAALNRSYALCQYTPEPTTPLPESDTSSQLIIKVMDSAQVWLPDVVILREWHRELQQLIDGFRAEMVEF